MCIIRSYAAVGLVPKTVLYLYEFNWQKNIVIIKHTQEIF